MRNAVRRASIWLGAAAMAAALAACSEEEKASNAAVKDPAPAETPKSAATEIPTVASGLSGKTCGEASYYADSLAGEKTASGEPYDPSKLTAAHKTLPLGAMIKVTRASNGSTVTVKVDDRGPYAPGRILDLSRAAAEALDLITAGKGEICIEAAG